LNEGYYGLDSSTHEAVVKKDKHGIASTGPFLLAANGTFLSDSDVYAGNVNYRRFSAIQWKDFDPLNISLPY
jgi:hypothetical protein